MTRLAEFAIIILLKLTPKNMDNQIKNALYIVLIAVLLAAGYAGVRLANAYSGAADQAAFTVAGEGKETAVPNIAKFSLTIITEKNSTDLPASQKENSEKVNKVIAFVKSLGIEDKDVKTENYFVTPRYNYYNCEAGGQCPPPAIVGYTISNTLTVKVRNFDNIGKLLSGAVENGVNNVSGPQFTIDDPTELQNSARAKAIAQARSKAQATAQAGGFRLGKLLGVSEGTSPSLVQQFTKESIGYGGGGATPSLEPGSDEVIINILLTYEIK